GLPRAAGGLPRRVRVDVGRARPGSARRVGSPAMRGYFLPGWGAPPELYAASLPAGWQALRPPSFAATDGDLRRYVERLRTLVARGREPVALAGHSMGAALAVLAAHEDPGRLAHLLLVAPAGLPLTKPIADSLADFARQLARRSYPREVARSFVDVAA